MKKSAKYDAGQAVPQLRFEEAVGLIHEGKFADECSAKMKSCVEHVMKKGGKTKLTLTLIFGAADDSGLNVLADVQLKLPPPTRRTQFLYSDKEGEVYEHSPDEVELELTMAPVAREETGKVTAMPVQRKG